MPPKKKNRNLDDWEKDFEALDELGNLKEPEEAPVKQAAKSKKKDKKKGKKAAAFNSDDEDVPAVLAEPEAEPQSEEEEEDAMPMTKPSKSKGKKKAAAVAAASFALLAEDDEEEAGAASDEEDEDAEEAAPVAAIVPVVAKIISIKPHPKADRLRIVKLAAGPVLGDVQVVSNAPGLDKHQLVALASVGCKMPGSGVDIAAAKVRGVESNGMICSAFDLGWVAEADGEAATIPKGMLPGDPVPEEAPEAEPQAAAPAADEDDEEGQLAAKPKSKKKGKKGKAPTDALFAALVGLDDEGEGEAAAEEANGKERAAEEEKDVTSAFGALALDEGDDLQLGSKKKSKKKTRAPLDLDALLAGEPSAGDEAASEAPAAAAPASAGPDKKKKKKKGKAAAVEEDDEDLDALLAELDAPATKPPPPAAAPLEAPSAASEKRKKKKGKAAAGGDAGGDDDLDAILAELGGGEGAKAEETAAPAAPAAAEANGASGAGDDEEAGEQVLSAAALKRKKKREKKKTGGGEEEETAAEEAAALKADKKGKKGAPKVSAVVRRMQEAVEAHRRAQEEAERAAEEERLREEEEARKAEEERLAKEEAAERKKAEKAARREQLRREGKLLTGKAKAEAERLQRMREQFLKQAGLDPGAELPKKKPVYGNRKRQQPKRDAAATPEPEESAAESQAAETAEPSETSPEPMETEQEVAASAKEVAVAPAEEPVVEEEVAAAPDSWEAAVDDWEAMDEDSVVLPGAEAKTAAGEEEQGKEERTGAKAAARPASAAAMVSSDQAASVAAGESEAEEESEEEEEEEGSSSDEEESSAEDESSSEEESSSEYSSSEDESTDSEAEMETRVEAQRAKRAARRRAAMAQRSPDDLRSPICCILGHVDTGKTKILDNIRRTNVQDSEAGGITQQIGATYIPGDAVLARTEELRKGKKFDLRLPGLLVIDTPGHESFSNLRSRGSGLCDIAVLVVDLMHGLEQQTIESINLLRMRKTPFVIAMNKVDRLYGWKSVANSPIMDALERQEGFVRAEFERRIEQIQLQLNEQGLNVALYWKNRDPKSYISIVPTSAHTGEGIPDLLQILVKLTQSAMTEKLMFVDDLQCTVLEVKSIEGLGTTVDVVLINGKLKEGDTIVVCGLGGPIVTQIRALLTPQPLREMRVKGSYIHHKELKAAMGVKIAAHNLESAVAGTQLFVVRPDDDLGALESEVMEDMQDIFASVDKTGEGVCVQASTLGSLEALLEFLKTPEVAIPVSAINIGPVHKRDVMRANVMIERGVKKYGVILAFDVPVTKEAKEMAEELGVNIFTADIIYHLFDQFTAYLKRVKEEEQEAARLDAVFPCVLRILPTCVFNKKDPIVVGVEVVEGIARIGTPLCVPSQGGIDLGRIASLEKDHKSVDTARRGDAVAMKIEAINPEQAARLYGRHFDHRDDLVSRISRKSIDILKTMFRDDLSKDDWRLVVRLKKVFNID